MVRVAIGVALVVVTGAACVGLGGLSETAPPPDDAGPQTPPLAAVPGILSIIAGGIGRFDVVARGGENLLVTIEDLPVGVTAAPATFQLAPTETTRNVELTAATSASQGTATVRVRASTSSGTAYEAQLFLDVRGAPGSLDTSFGDRGATTLNAFVGSIVALGVRPDGVITAVGSAGEAPALDVGIARFTANGALDTTFGTGGHVVRDVKGQDRLRSAFVTADGQSVIGSQSTTADIARFAADGALDPSFNQDGVFSFPTGFGRVMAVAPYGGGSVLAGGDAPPGLSGGTPRAAVARLTASGSADSFGTFFGVAFDTTNDGIVTALATKSDGSIVAAGDVSNTSLIVLGLNKSGTITFKTTESLGGDTVAVTSIAVDASDRGVVGGYTRGTAPDAASRPFVRRYLATGALDSAFGSGGAATLPLQSGEVRAIALDDQGRIVLAGVAHTGSGAPSFAVMRLLTDGTPDGTFGSNGLTETSIVPGADYANAMVIRLDGRIIVGGAAESPKPGFAIARYWP